MDDPADEVAAGQRGGSRARGLVRRLVAAALLIACSVPAPAFAVEAMVVDPAAERVMLADVVEAYDVDGRDLSLRGQDGEPVVEAAASPGNEDPRWLGFALTNDSEEPLVRWLVVENSGSSDSGIFAPVLAGPRLVSVTAAGGESQPRRERGRLDIFEITLPAGETVTFVGEAAGPPPRLLALWEPGAYTSARRALAFFHGLLVGIVGLLAIFLTSLYVVRRRLMYPAAAAVGWAALAVLAADFGLWERGFGIGPGAASALRAIAEAAFAGAAAFLLSAFLELRARRPKLADAARGLIAAAALAGLVSLVFPGFGAAVARLLTGVVALAGAAAIGYFLAARSARALALVPGWFVFALFTLLAGLVYSGALPGDLARPVHVAAIGLVVMIFAFTVMQYAFDADVAPDANARELALKAVAFAASDIILWDWRVDEEEITVGTELEAALGVARSSLNGEQNRWLDHVHQLDRDRFVQIANAAVAGEHGVIDTELRLRTSAGGQRWYRLRARSVAREDGAATRLVGSLEDITALRNSRDRLLRDAVRDALTGLPNRALFLDRLTRAVARVDSHGGRDPSVLIIDIDRFKNVNQGFGHAVGDSILTVISQRMSAMMDAADTLARIQGDQFAAIVVSAARPDDVTASAGDLGQALKQPIFVGDQEVFLTASIGIATYDRQRHDSANDLLREAELAMIHAKTAGADRIEVFRPSMQSARSDRLTIESDLRRALERSEIELLYQPIVSLAEERVAGFEALMRWHHPDQGQLAPDDFIEIAEEVGLIVELGHFALDTAARQLALWLRTYTDAPDLFVSVNVSSRQIFRQDLMRDVRLVTTRSAIPPGAIKLEITESLVMENPELAAYVLERLRAMGAGLSLDDFGTGYSALSYLQRFPFDTVKVDKSLITGGRDNAPVIVKSIVNMAHDLGMEVVAEGVESAHDVEYLRGIGCEYGQGYHFAPPLSVEDATKYLAEWR